MLGESRQDLELLDNFKRAWKIWFSKSIVIPEHYEPLCLGRSEKDEAALLAEDVIKSFLQNTQKKVLLILGPSGSGKSSLGQKLIHDLWQADLGYLPLWISLAKQQEIGEEFIERFLEKELNFDRKSSSEIEAPWLFILDGYDELQPEHLGKNLHRLAAISRWNAKVIITCRSEVAPTSDKQINFFSPYIRGEQDRQGLEVLYLQPLTLKQQEHYFRSSFKPEETSGALDAWKRIPGLQELGQTPFLLQLIAKHLPQILAKHNNENGLSQLVLTRLDLYRSFKEYWFKRQKERLLAQGKITRDSWDIEKDFEEYTQRLARELHRKKLTSFKIPYAESLEMVEERQEKRSINSGSSFLSFSEGHIVSTVNFSPEEPLVALLAERGQWHCKDDNINPLELVRQGCPLKALGGGEWSFLHKSLLEYFASERLFQSMGNQVGIAFGRDLNSELLVNDIAFMQFAADEVKKNKEFKEALWQVIRESRHEARVQIAAANAISILNWAGESFAHQDLRRVRIASANLVGAVLDSANLSDADLRGVVLEGAWLNNANFQRACVDNIVFNQWPYLNVKNGGGYYCCSLDRQWLAVAVNNDIEIYDKGHNLKHIFIGHGESVYAIAFSANGLLASGSGDKTIKLWDMESLSLKCTLTGHIRAVDAIAFSENGKLIASGSWDNTVKLWDIETFSLKHTFEGHNEPVRSVVFSTVGVLASGSDDKTIKLWDIENFTLKHTFEGHTSIVDSVAFSTNGLLASGSSDNTIKLWNVENLTLVHTFTGHNSAVRSIAFSPNGMLASGSNDYTVKLWDVENLTLKHTFTGHSHVIANVTFLADEILTSGSWDHTIKFWETKTCLKHSYNGHSSMVMCVALSSDGILASGSVDNTIKLWDIKSGILKNTLESHRETVMAVAFLADGQLASGSDDEVVNLWDIKRNVLNHTFQGHDKTVTGMTLSSNGILAVGIWNNNIELWDIKSGILKHTLKGHTKIVTKTAFLGSKLLASASQDKTVKLWDIERGILKHTFEDHYSIFFGNVAFSSAGLLAFGSKDNTIKLWDIENIKLKNSLRGHSDKVTSIVFSSDGELLASGSKDGAVKIWHLQEGKFLQTLSCLDEVYSLIFSSDGLYLVVAAGSAVLLWQRHSTANPSSPFTLLYRFSQDIKLSAQVLNLTQVTGMTEDSKYYELLTQLGATGLPNFKQNSDKILSQREQAEYCESPIEPLLKMQYESYKLAPRGNWIAAMVRNKTNQNFHHIFLLLEHVESIEDDRFPAYHRFKRIDLFLDDRFEYSDYLGLSWQGKSVIVMAEKGVEDIKILLESCQYKTYPLNPEQASQLIANIEREQKSPPRYDTVGKSFILGTGHNCRSWPEAMLVEVGCNIKQQTNWIDHVEEGSSQRRLQDHREPEILPTSKRCTIS